MTRVLVLGSAGQLARALARATPPEGWALEFAGRERCDLTRPDAARDLIMTAKPDVVINTAAYTAVDRAESEPELAHALNAEAPLVLAEATRRGGSLLIHVSTDYVFGGVAGAPFAEADPVAPLQTYGRSKAEGERRVVAADPGALVVRTAWLISEMSGFVRAISSRALRGETLKVVDDQRGNPTHADDLAAALLGVAQRRLAGLGEGGLLHVAGPLAATWHELATAIISRLEPGEAELSRPSPIASSEYGAPAARPQDSRLDVTRLKSIWDMELRPWTAWAAETAQVGQSSALFGVEKGQQSDG